MKSPILAYLEHLHERFRGDDRGEVASYIPQLGRADPNWFGICVATTDGRVYEVGDTRIPFTIQSMSKPFTYGLALADRGREAVALKVGVEPSGDAFNEISLAPGTGRPLNPMINAGAITATSLVAGDGLQGRLDRILDTYSLYAARRLEVDEEVFASELETGHRNRAIGHMLRNFNILPDDPDVALELYFRQCSVAVDCRDVSVMAATLANGGRNPITSAEAVPEELVERVLSVMTTCGMYDGSGRWVDSVGLPAKSGVSGGIFAVLPGQLALCVFSPRLDEQGNSVRGVQVCQAIAREQNLHSLRVARSARSTIRANYGVDSVPSRRRRSPSQVQALHDLGRRAVVYELQGDLLFAGTERLIRGVVDSAETLDVAVLDLRPVDRIEAPAARLLLELRASMLAAGKELAFVAHGGHRGLADAAGTEVDPLLLMFPNLDLAREWCEDHLLAHEGLFGPAVPAITIEQHRLCRGLDPSEIEELDGLLVERLYAAGERIIKAGDAAGEVFLVLAGEVGVYIKLATGGLRRLASLPPGSTVGELAVVGESTRTADVVAERAAKLMSLSAVTFEQLGTTNPRLKAQLLQNMLANAYEAVSRMSRELAALAHEG